MNYFDSIYSSDLPHRAVSVYMYLVHMANSEGHCWPSEGRIARDLSMSKSTVKRAIADLRKSGYVKCKQQYRPNGAKSSLLFTLPDFSKYRTTKG